MAGCGLQLIIRYSKKPTCRIFDSDWSESYLHCFYCQDRDRHPRRHQCSLDPDPSERQQRAALRLHPISDQLPGSARHRHFRYGRLLEKDQRGSMYKPIKRKHDKPCRAGLYLYA